MCNEEKANNPACVFLFSLCVVCTLRSNSICPLGTHVPSCWKERTCGDIEICLPIVVNSNKHNTLRRTFFWFSLPSYFFSLLNLDSALLWGERCCCFFLTQLTSFHPILFSLGRAGAPLCRGVFLKPRKKSIWEAAIVFMKQWALGESRNGWWKIPREWQTNKGSVSPGTSFRLQNPDVESCVVKIKEDLLILMENRMILS